LLALIVEILQVEIYRREGFLKGVDHFDCTFLVEQDVAHQPLLDGRKLEGLPFHVYKSIASRFFGLVTKHACDRQTDRIMTPKTALA